MKDSLFEFIFDELFKSRSFYKYSIKWQINILRG